jgi:hypothetical protein
MMGRKSVLSRRKQQCKETITEAEAKIENTNAAVSGGLKVLGISRSESAVGWPV